MFEIKRSHAASIKNSDRLKKLLTALQSGRMMTTKELQNITGGVAINSNIHELRQNGIKIAPAVYMGMTDTRSKVYGYQLEVNNG
jgi:bacteriocin-like protein